MPTDTFRDTSALVFGASGFLGRPLVRRLAQSGARVHAVSRRAGPGRDQDGVMWARCDASDAGQVDALFEAVRPRLVYNLTSDSRGGREIELIPDSLRNDLIAAVNIMLAACRHRSGLLITTGSLEEPVGDAGDAVPSSPYAAAKWAGATYARMMAALYDLPVTILRPFMTYGPGQKPFKLVPSVLEGLIEGRPIPLSSGHRLVDWVFLDDVVDAFVRAAEAPPAGTVPIDIGSGALLSIRDFLSIAAELTGGADLLRFGALQDRPMEIEKAAITDPADRLLGWRASTAPDQGLAATIMEIRATRRLGRPASP